ncbi:MAG: hypothetical protein C0501_29300 [Isosphaera sp.]|nr:hypothetical protein [Isosphaera sp.]
MKDRARYGVLAGFLVLAAGAGVAVYLLASPSRHPDAVTPEGTVTQTRLTSLAEVYALHGTLRKRPPASFEELRAFAAALSPQHGGPITLSEDRLTSLRDGQPLVVRYGLPLAEAAPGPVVAHEQDGAGGRRFVVFVGTRRVEEVDEARFRELVR